MPMADSIGNSGVAFEVWPLEMLNNSKLRVNEHIYFSQAEDMDFIRKINTFKKITQFLNSRSQLSFGKTVDGI